MPTKGKTMRKTRPPAYDNETDHAPELRRLILASTRLEDSERPTQRLDWSKIISEQFRAWMAEIALINEGHRRAHEIGKLARLQRKRGMSLH